ncbi:hypothetical protein D3C72_2339460 [compost metagenome]
MVPLISLHLHDNHVTSLRWTVKFAETAFIPAFLVEVVRIAVLPPRIIHTIVGQLNAMGLTKIAHHKPPTVEMAEHKGALQQREFTARLDGT